MRILTVVLTSFFVWAGAGWAETPSAPSVADAPAAAVPAVAVAVPAAAPGTGAGATVLAEGGTCNAAAAATTAAVGLRPFPFPSECIDCRPCSVQGECGIQGGAFLGVCSPPNSSYCHYLSYSSCTCY